MDTSALKSFAPAARRLLIDQVTARLDLVLDAASAARREHPKAVKELEGAIVERGREQVIEQVAYTWFNRFMALRYMDVQGYTNPLVVSPAEGATRPEILSEALAGNLPEGAPEAVSALLTGRSPSGDPQAEAYRHLLVHACNRWHETMPFLFEPIDDYSELLLPEDLLSPNAILARLREVMTEEACGDVEIIGWLYQFYISEKKDEVFAGLRKNQKITPENIPAATQLFTPHWIVRYLVENSLGRLWLLNRPDSKLAARMDYYIAPEEPETDFLRVSRPEEIKICDPACGSGHMLTYAFDLLYAIYEEEGYDPTEIPALILQHNLTGIDIDDRAGALAAFALAMKAAARLGRRRFLRMEVKPDIVVLQNVTFTPTEMQDVAALAGRDLFTDELRETLLQFEQAKNFGSLIVPKLRDPAETLRVVKAREYGSDLLLRDVRERVAGVLRMAEALSPKYHVVVANPPYMGGRGMNKKLDDFVKSNYPDSKSDLFATFMERALKLCIKRGLMAMINMQSWMFLSSYEKLRAKLLSDTMILSMVHLGERAFDSIGGAVVSTTAFVIENDHSVNHKGTFIRLVEGSSEAEKEMQLREAIENPACGWFYRASAEDFLKLPRAVVAYWLPKNAINSFALDALHVKFSSGGRLKTHDDERYVRFIWEVENKSRDNKWVELSHGGDFRRWYGLRLRVVDWRPNATEFYASNGGLHNEKYWRRPGITCSKITSSTNSFRFKPEQQEFSSLAPTIFESQDDSRSLKSALGLVNSKVSQELLWAINPTMTLNVGDILSLPNISPNPAGDLLISELINISREDWDAYETSWDFTTLPLLQPDHRADTLAETYANLRAHWQGMTDEMQRLEEENNRIFIDAYGLQDELTPEVPIQEITLTCNPAYRYGVKGSEEDREARLREDTVAEFLHYAVGCMFGRYSLDAPGLILANQGEGIEEYLARVPDPTFAPDRDNVIPVLDADWFADDIVARARDFLRVTFGEAKFRENLAFIEKALGKDLRRWFTKDFFDYHVRRYKKRPIYWMFSSPKGSFNALIYMHRYRPDTVSVLLNDYLRAFIAKLEAERRRLELLADDASATQTQRTRALKEVAGVAKQLDELNAWERDVIFPLAQRRIEIDLDEGVKANYPKFGAALKKIPGLEAKGE